MPFTLLFATQPATAAGKGAPAPPQLLDSAVESVLQSATRAHSGKSSAGTDTFCLYGGPGSLLGKFQNAAHGIDQQGWIGVDATEDEPVWQRSSFRSPTGSTAMWCGLEANQDPGWSTPPGYGNGWNALLTYTRTPTDPSVGQTIDLSFVFHHDLEPGFDFLIVEYDQGTTVRTVMSRSGRTIAPLQFPDDVTVLQSIVFAGNDYGTNGKIKIRLRVTSDVAWSDEDGLYPSDGAAQIDDITVSGNGFSDFEDFEQPSTQWLPQISPYAGNFAKIFFRMTDLDPCAENTTPFAAFIDDGTPPSNPFYTGTGTGGTLSPTWNYGVPGAWVVNYNGGISLGALQLENEWWSPEIEWDLPGPADDGLNTQGAFIRFSIWAHLPINYNVLAHWQVRSRDAGTGLWSPWADNGFVYWGSSTLWQNRQQDVTHLLLPDPDRVQLRFGVGEGTLEWPAPDATPAPCFDNVSLQKYTIGGPTIVANEQSLFADTFASSGLTDVSTQAARDLLDCRVDMARSVTSGGASVPIRSGDSLVVRVTSALPGVEISDPGSQIRLHYSLNLNPLFESAIRPNAAITGSGGLYGWAQSEGFVGATQAITSNGQPVADLYAFDLPDDGFLYPGDVLEYFIEAVDDGGGTSTLPADLSSYDDGPTGLPFDVRFQVRALPTYTSITGQQPEILVWDDAGNPTHVAAMRQGLADSGLSAGIHYDLYTTRAAAAFVDNGLGSASANGRGHGATPEQLTGYDCLVYEAGDRTVALLSDGSDNYANDKANDVALLQGWFDAAADRYVVHFGDNLAWFLGGNPAQGASASVSQLAYLSSVMGVAVHAPTVKIDIDAQTAPRVLPLPAAPWSDDDYVAFGGCPILNGFDSIAPVVGAVAAHGFEVSSAPGTTYPIGPGRAASVVWDRLVDVGGTGYRKVSVTFPYGMNYVYGSPAKGQSTALGTLISDVFALFGSHFGGEVDAPPAEALRIFAPVPNPFNPQTTLRFALGRAAMGSVRVYNLRGELVCALAEDAVFSAGETQLRWDGRDDAGAALASGVYVVRFDIDGFRESQKVVLLK